MKNLYFLFLLLIISKYCHSQIKGWPDVRNYVCLIEGELHNGRIYNGTGFIIKHKGHFYLVTNFHVLAGVEGTNIGNGIDTNKISKQFWFWFKVKDGLESSGGFPTIRMTNGLANLNFRYYRLGNNVLDVAVFPLTSFTGKYYFDDRYIDSANALAVNEKLQVVGFPGGKPVAIKNNLIPIVDTLRMTLDQGPIFHFSGVTKPGSSGSPIFKRSNAFPFVKIVGVAFWGNPNVTGAAVRTDFFYEMLQH